MAIALERAPAQPRPWLAAGRVLVVACADLFAHGIIGRGRPTRLSRRTGRLARR